MGHAFLFIFLTLDNLSSNIGSMDNQSTGKSHKALIITIATATLLLAGAGTANYLQYQHGKKQERHFTYQISSLQADKKEQQGQITALNATIDGLKTEVKHLNSEIVLLQAQHEEQQLNEKKTQARQELTARGYTPSEYKRELVHAVQNDNIELLKLLLTAGVDPNYSDVLIEAAESGKEECVKLLLAAPGIDVNRADDDGWTPLYRAAGYGRTECVKLCFGVTRSGSCHVGAVLLSESAL